MTPHLRSDTNARIPFAILGILLLIASSLASTIIIHLDTQQAIPTTSILDLNAITRLTQTAQNDITNALNRAATQALITIGHTPVQTPTNGTRHDTLIHRLQHAVYNNLTQYLLAQYTDNQYTDGTYTITIPLTNDTPHLTPDQITFTTINLTLHRTTIPLLGPDPILNSPAYLQATLPLPITITPYTDPTTIIKNQTLTITTLITSRYLLLQTLTDDYQHQLTTTPGPLWTFTTTTSTLYSLTRAWKHHHTGRPTNIVDNHHLTLLINTGLLLTQTQTLHTTNPLTILSLLSHTHQTLTQPDPPPLQTFNTQNTQTGTTINTTTITQGTANLDAGDTLTTPIPTSPLLTLQSLTDPILHTTTAVTLTFTKPDNPDQTETIPYNTTQLTTTITDRQTNGWTLTTTTPITTHNTTTLATLQNLTATIYHATLATTVTNRTQATIHIDPPGPPWTDGPTTPWIPTTITTGPKTNITPPKGTITHNTSLYQENYTVTYTRTHTYTQTIDNTTIYHNTTDTTTENITLHTILQTTAPIDNTSDDITDILYTNTTLNDPNLQDTPTTYLTLHPDTDPDKQTLITTQHNTGTTSLQTTIQGTIPDWVLTETWDALTTIATTLANITTTTNATDTPYPPDLIHTTITTLTNHYLTNITDYLDYTTYHPGPLFQSTGKKAVYYARVWYLNTINNTLTTTAHTLDDQLQDAIQTAIPANSTYTPQTIQDTLAQTTDALKDRFTIPFAIPMSLTSDHYPTWSEPVLLSISQSPHYLDPYRPITNGTEETWTLKIRNRCLFGPTGLPVLPPSPVTPWILTLNIWAIDVEGEYLRFTVLDANDQTAYNPIIGHTPQPYVREAAVVTDGDDVIGENTRVSFAFSTLCFAVVPPFGMMCGDLQPDWMDDSTPGFGL
jgi:hypothetical protein